MYLAALKASDSASKSEFVGSLEKAGEELIATRPTAINLAWAVDRQLRRLKDEEGSVDLGGRRIIKKAGEIADEDAEFCRQIGLHGLPLIRDISERKGGQPVNILTHCNAGWLAFVDYGSATAPVYAAFDEGLPVHVWVDETRPRNQGAGLTAWELSQHGVPHTLIVDNAGGHLMQQGLVDMVITGTDRTTHTGDVANKIGTYLKALAAKDNGCPFYVALPSSTFDWEIEDGVRGIPIEQRDADEVKYVTGARPDGEVDSVLIAPPESPAANFAFDVTPRQLITGLITERGVCEASKDAVLNLYPEKYR
jgi:methylthioribose-1-phosphate isomerase